MLGERDRTEQVLQRREMRRRQVKIGMAMQAVGVHGLQEMQDKIAAGIPLNLSVGEIIRLLEVGAKLELKARGEDPASQFTSIQVIVSSAPPPDDDETEMPPIIN